MNTAVDYQSKHYQRILPVQLLKDFNLALYGQTKHPGITKLIQEATDVLLSMYCLIHQKMGQ